MTSATQTAVQTTIGAAMAAKSTEADVEITVEESQLSKEALKVAYRAIDKAYDIQIGKDGIEETEQKLEGLRGKVGEHVYDVLKRALGEVGEHLKLARAYFLALCLAAEKQLVNKHIKNSGEQSSITKLIPLWSQYKSSLAKGLEVGINPHELIPDTESPKYATAAQYRKAVQDYEAIQRAKGSQAGNERQSNGQTATQLSVVTKGWSEKLQPAMSVMCQELNRLTHADQDQFVTAVMAIASQAHDLAEQRLKEAMAPSNGEHRTEPMDLSDLDPGTKAAMAATLETHAKEGKQAEGKVVAEELARASRNTDRKRGSARVA